MLRICRGDSDLNLMNVWGNNGAATEGNGKPGQEGWLAQKDVSSLIHVVETDVGHGMIGKAGSYSGATDLEVETTIGRGERRARV